MPSCKAIYEANLTRKIFVVSLFNMIVRGKDRGVVILSVDGAAKQKMW